MSNYDSDAEYDDIVLRTVKVAAATGPLIILPGPAEIMAVTNLWATMAIEIAQRNGVQLEKKSVAKIMTAVLAGAGAYVGGAKLFNTIISKVPGIGMVIGAGVNSAVNVAFTLWLAFALIDLFDESKGEKKLEDYIAFLVGELKPRLGGEKLKRAAAFIKRRRK